MAIIYIHMPTTIQLHLLTILDLYLSQSPWKLRPMRPKKTGAVQDFLDISVAVIGELKQNESVNFIQLMRHGDSPWMIDNSGRPTPFYYDHIDLKNRMSKNADGFDVLTLSDSPSGAVYENIQYYVSVVLVKTECRRGQTRFSWERPMPALMCASKVKIIGEREWSFRPFSANRYGYDNSGIVGLPNMRLILKSLLENRKWLIKNLCTGPITVE